MPRFTRLILFLTTLSLLIVPMGDSAKAQVDPTAGEIAGFLVAGDAASCAPEPPNPASLSHVRCTGGSFSGISGVGIVATRPLVPDPRMAVCAGVDLPGVVPFNTRETIAEGRGRIEQVTLRIPGGRVIDSTGISDPTHCDIRIEGSFHRVGTLAIGRLTLDVHLDTGDARQFRHGPNTGDPYCARFVATAVPFAGPDGGTLVTAVVEGRGCGDLVSEPPNPVGSLLHGRLPGDDNDPLHHDECRLSIQPPEVPVNCFLGV